MHFMFKTSQLLPDLIIAMGLSTNFYALHISNSISLSKTIGPPIYVDNYYY